ncbi:MAG: hypothetical protein LBH25_09585 [Fibromonadaceae bacterium]|jgi:hypothetical protein|nr:hypothetical protein [Fibromonadaceae bacterium]
MGFFGPDTAKINKNYTNSVNDATSQFTGSMQPHMNAGAGLVDGNGKLTYGASNASAALPSQQMDVLGSVGSYLDPSMSFQINAANDQIANRYGNSGSLFSGAAGNAISENTRSMAEAGWGQAWDRAMADNSRINSLGQQQFSNQMAIDQFNNDASNMNFGQQFGINSQNFSNANDVYGTRLGTQVNAANAKMQTSMAQKSPWDVIMDAGKLAVGGASAVGGLG